MAAQRGRGRPPLAWFSGGAAAALPVGTAVVLDLGDRGTRIRGRTVSSVAGELVVLVGPDRYRTVPVESIARARVVAGRLEDGDPVVRPGVPARDWRGGIVRHDGRRVYVETLTGFEWIDEDELEHAEARPVALALAGSAS